MTTMHSAWMILIAAVALPTSGASAANAAPEGESADARVQGLYEGTGKDLDGPFKIEARLVAEGRGSFWMLVRQFRGEDKLVHAELLGSMAGGAVALSSRPGGAEWKAAWAEGAVKGSCGREGTFELRRVERKSPTMGKKPPSGAIVLWDGKDFSEMVPARGAAWDASAVGEDGSIQVPKGGMDSKRAFDGSFDLHVEFLIPLRPTAHGQGRGNSGVYLPDGQEIQVLDSFGDVTYQGGGCGGLYAHKDPDTMDVIESLKDQPHFKYNLSSLPPLEWQTYDVEYRVDTKDGKPAGRPVVTVDQNGVRIHDKVAIRANARKGGFHFQDHGNPVRYRNIWVMPVEGK